MNCHSNADAGFFKCCEGDLCNLNLAVEPLPATAVGKSHSHKLELHTAPALD